MRDTSTSAAQMVSRETLLNMWRTMHLGRNFEEHLQWLFSKGLVYGTMHLSIGEEATGVGTIFALEPQDYIFATHRGHTQAISRGIDPKNIMAEILAKAPGTSKGKGGSMHIADPSRNFYNADGILGANSVLALGTALATKKRKEENRITVVFVGDGSSNEGATWEAFNLASVWKLPVLWVCTNNLYGMSTHISKAMKNTDITTRAYPFDMPSKSIDGNNILEVYHTIKEAREYVAAGNGPMLVVENTYRIAGHSRSDANLYRSKDEIEAWKAKCPIKAFREYLTENGFSAEELDAIAKQAADEICAAEEFALNAPEPSIDELLSDVYA